MECIFSASTATNFDNLPALHQPWWCLREINACTSLPKKTLDMSLTYSYFHCYLQ